MPGTRMCKPTSSPLHSLPAHTTIIPTAIPVRDM